MKARILGLLALAGCRQIIGIDLSTSDAGNERSDGSSPLNNVIVLATGQTYVSNIAVDATNVYWATGAGNVVKCTIGGCGNTPIVLASGQNAAAVAVDATNVYWVNDNHAGGGAVMKCAIGGCDYSPTALAVAAYSGSVAVDSTHVYWSAGGQEVAECGLTGCAGDAGPAPVVLASAIRPGTIVAANGGIYFADQPVGSGNPEITACSAGTCTHLANTAKQVNDRIAIDSTSAYWSEGDGMYTCTLAACNQARICAGSGGTHVAVDATRVFFLVPPYAELTTCPIEGTPTTQPTSIGSLKGGSTIADFTIDSTNLYWVANDGTVNQMPKPK